MEPKIALDIDGTLLDYNYIPGAQARTNDALIAEIAKLTSRVALVTNQGGLVWGMKGSKRKDGRGYPDVVDFVARYRFLRTELVRAGVEVDELNVCVFHPTAPQPDIEITAHWLSRFLSIGLYPPALVYTASRYRKPSPDMLLESGATIYYGDSDEDSQAALAAGIEFVMVDRFFG